MQVFIDCTQGQEYYLKIAFGMRIPFQTCSCCLILFYLVPVVKVYGWQMCISIHVSIWHWHLKILLFVGEWISLIWWENLEATFIQDWTLASYHSRCDLVHYIHFWKVIFTCFQTLVSGHWKSSQPNKFSYSILSGIFLIPNQTSVHSQFKHIKPCRTFIHINTQGTENYGP